MGLHLSVTRDHDKNLLITSKKQEIHECNVEIEKTKHEIAALHTEIIKIELKMPKDKRRSSYVQNAKGFNLDSFKTKEFDASAPKDMLTPEFVSDFMKTSNAKNQEDLAKANKKLKAAEKKLEVSRCLRTASPAMRALATSLGGGLAGGRESRECGVSGLSFLIALRPTAIASLFSTSGTSPVPLSLRIHADPGPRNPKPKRRTSTRASTVCSRASPSAWRTAGQRAWATNAEER
jgi:hypothetical protein